MNARWSGRKTVVFYLLFLSTGSMISCSLYTTQPQSPPPALNQEERDLNQGGGIEDYLEGQTKIKDSQIEVFWLGNEIEVMTLSNPQFGQSGAALAVKVGSYDDPDEALGLAHFLEHVLFISNEEYPNVNELFNFVSENGGATNAYTKTKITNFGFSVNNDAFDGALSRFSAFFKNPTFDPQFLEKEKQAVHSEYQKNLNNEIWRANAVSKLFMNPKHPSSRFVIGSAQTLASVTRDQVVAFYQKHYSANLMKLVLASPLKPEELKSLAYKYFEGIKNSKLKGKKIKEKSFIAPAKKTLILSKSLIDRHTLSVAFFGTVPEQTTWKDKAEDLVARVISHEGPGSLAAVLKNEGLIVYLQADSSQVDMILTDEGVRNVPLILNRLTSFIKFALEKELPEELFLELKREKELSFKDLTVNPDLGTMQSLVAQLFEYPGLETFRHSLLLEDFRPDLYKEYLRCCFNMNNAQIQLSSPTVKGDHVEPYFNVDYTTQELSPSVFEPKDLELFALPTVGSYFPKSFEMISEEKVISAPFYQKKQRGEIMAKVDTILDQPTASLNLVIYSTMAENIKNTVLNNLYFLVKSYEGLRWRSDLNHGHYTFYLLPADHQKMSLILNGYSDQLSSILKDFFVGRENLSAMKEVTISEQEFLNIKAQFKAQLSNIFLGEPYNVLDFQKKILLTDDYSLADYAQALESLQLEDLRQYVKEYFKNNYLKIYSYGNWRPDQSNSIYSDFFETIGQGSESNPFSGDPESMIKLYRWPQTDEKFEFVYKGQSPNNSVMQYWSLGPWNLENDVYGAFLNLLIGEAFFEELRTRQQIGYVAQAGVSVWPNQITLVTLMQSQLHPKELSDRATHFLSDYLTRSIPTLTDESFEGFRKVILDSLDNPSTKMDTRAMIFFGNAQSFPAGFDYQAEKILKVSEVKREDFQKWLSEKVNTFTKAPVTLSYYSPGAEIKPEEGVRQITEQDIKTLSWPKENRSMGTLPGNH